MSGLADLSRIGETLDEQDNEVHDDSSTHENGGVGKRRGRPSGVSYVLEPVEKPKLKKRKGREYTRVSTKITENLLSRLNAVKVTSNTGLGLISIETEAKNSIQQFSSEELNNILSELSKIEKEQVKDETKTYLNTLVANGEQHVKDIVSTYRNADSLTLRNKLGETQKAITKAKDALRRLQECEQLLNAYIENSTGTVLSFKVLRKAVRNLQAERESAELNTTLF